MREAIQIVCCCGGGRRRVGRKGTENISQPWGDLTIVDIKFNYDAHNSITVDLIWLSLIQSL